MAELEARGVRFHVQRLGFGRGPHPADGTTAGRPVVFLHGLVMDNLSSYYFTLANPVAKRLPVLLYDLRGHGRSARPATGYTVADMVADLVALLDAAALDGPVHLVGNSVGGLLALAFAVAQPERAASLALIDAHVSHAGWGSAMAATLGLEGAARDRKIAENFQSWLGRHSARKRTKLAENAKGLVYGTSLVSDIAASPPLAEAALRRLATPTLCLYGAQSDVRERGEWLARTLPHARLQLVAGASHSVLWEATETVKAALLGWLEEQEEERS